MGVGMSEKTKKVLRICSGLIALILIGLTIAISVKATSRPANGIGGVVNEDLSSVVTIHEEPSMLGTVVQILETGMEVRIVNSTENNDLLWYNVYVGENQGWVQARFITVQLEESIEQE
jgi:hypothetical protein